jgi:hypothetical protein
LIKWALVGWLVGKPPPVQPCSLEGDEPTEVSAPRNVTMYLNYHYVCKLPAAGVVVAVKSSSRHVDTRRIGIRKREDRLRSCSKSRDLVNGGKAVVCHCLVLEGRRVIIWGLCVAGP